MRKRTFFCRGRRDFTLKAFLKQTSEHHRTNWESKNLYLSPTHFVNFQSTYWDQFYVKFSKKSFIVGARDYKMWRGANFWLFWGSYRPSQVIYVTLQLLVLKNNADNNLKKKRRQISKYIKKPTARFITQKARKKFVLSPIQKDIISYHSDFIGSLLKPERMTIFFSFTFETCTNW